jgi:hypothetical protein
LKTEVFRWSDLAFSREDGLSRESSAPDLAYGVATSGGDAESTPPPSRAGKSKLSATVFPPARWRTNLTEPY